MRKTRSSSPEQRNILYFIFGLVHAALFCIAFTIPVTTAITSQLGITGANYFNLIATGLVIVFAAAIIASWVSIGHSKVFSLGSESRWPKFGPSAEGIKLIAAFVTAVLFLVTAILFLPMLVSWLVPATASAAFTSAGGVIANQDPILYGAILGSVILVLMINLFCSQMAGRLLKIPESNDPRKAALLQDNQELTLSPSQQAALKKFLQALNSEHTQAEKSP